MSFYFTLMLGPSVGLLDLDRRLIEGGLDDTLLTIEAGVPTLMFDAGWVSNRVQSIHDAIGRVEGLLGERVVRRVLPDDLVNSDEVIRRCQVSQYSFSKWVLPEPITILAGRPTWSWLGLMDYLQGKDLQVDIDLARAIVEINEGLTSKKNFGQALTLSFARVQTVDLENGAVSLRSIPDKGVEFDCFVPSFGSTSPLLSLMPAKGDCCVVGWFEGEPSSRPQILKWLSPHPLFLETS